MSEEIIWQDMVFMVGGFIFAPALVFAIVRKTRYPLMTSIPTILVLLAYLVNYATMGFWLAFISTGLTALVWGVIAWQALKGKANKVNE